MSLPTINDVQAVEPVLTNMLVGYMQDERRFVASRVFPPIPTSKDSGTYYLFTKKYWFLNQMEERTPGQQYARADFGVSTATFTTLQYALAKAIADEERQNSQLPMDLETAAVSFLGQQNLLKKEVQFSTDFMKTGVWGTDDDNSTTDWDDYASGDPFTDIANTASGTISDNTGMMANSIVMGRPVHDAIRNHPDIIDRLKYTSAATLAGIEGALAAVFGLANWYVSYASYTNTNEAADFTASRIVDDDALVCYVTPSPGIMTASAGYTFNWSGGGGMGVILRNRDDLNDSDLIKHKMQWDQKAVATDCGYFFADVV